MTFRSGNAEPKIAAVVPAHNEEKTVGEVVRALKGVPRVGAVVVVSDGSTDRTAEEAERAGADVVLRLASRGGKGQALARGVAATDAGILFFCDADYRGLRTDHIEGILAPVLSGALAMCVGLRDRGPIVTRIERFLPYIGGERALRREVFAHVPARFMRGFGAELALDESCKANGWRYAAVVTRGLDQVRKPEKVGWIRGILGYAGMIGELIGAFVVFRLHRNAFRHEQH